MYPYNPSTQVTVRGSEVQGHPFLPLLPREFQEASLEYRTPWIQKEKGANLETTPKMEAEPQ